MTVTKGGCQPVSVADGPAAEYLLLTPRLVARLAGRHLGRLWRQANTAGFYVCVVTEPSIQRA